MRSRALVLAIAVLASRHAVAAALDPFDFVSGGAFPAGSVLIDSTDLTVDDVAWAGAELVAQTGAPDIAVFTFDGDAVTGSATLVGTRPVAILFQGPATISGNWSVVSGRGTGDTPGIPSIDGGTGGGGFGGQGGAGGNSPGGIAFGDLFSTLEAGSNGGARGASAGGTGGGAVEIGATGLLDLSGATISADGNSGQTVGGDGLGGGSGGGISLHAFTVTFNPDTELSVSGGNGGNHDAGPFEIGYGGGGGGGGRVAVLWNASGSFTPSTATIVVLGGSAGVTEQGSPGPGQVGVFADQSSLTIGVPEPGAAMLGTVAFAVLAWRVRASRTAPVS